MVNKNKWLFITSFVLAVFLTSCASDAGKDLRKLSNATFEFDIYGGYVREDMARQSLIIGLEKTTYTTYHANSSISLKFERKTDTAAYNALLGLFADKGFANLNENYTLPEGIAVLDAGVGMIRLVADDYDKRIMINPFVFDYLPDNVKAIVVEMQSRMDKVFDLNDAQLKEFSEYWIKKAPTYAYDGSSLTYVNHAVRESFPVTYDIEYVFMSSSEGYGDRKDNITGNLPAQVLTNHTIQLTISKGKILWAVIDERWDELTQRMIRDYEMKFQPIQCTETPWRAWYRNINITSDKQPPEEQLVVSFYSTNYGIIVKDFKMRYADNPVLAVCGNPESYYITANVSNFDIGKMAKLGWIDISEIA